jgi:hypothetical protein
MTTPISDPAPTLRTGTASGVTAIVSGVIALVIFAFGTYLVMVMPSDEGGWVIAIALVVLALFMNIAALVAFVGWLAARPTPARRLGLIGFLLAVVPIALTAIAFAAWFINGL